MTTQSAALAALERLEAAAQAAPGQSFYRAVPNMGTPVTPVVAAPAVAELPVASASGDVGATAPEAPAGAAAEGAPAPPAPAGAAAEGAPAPAAAEGAPAPAAPAATADSDTAIGDLGKHGDSMELDPHVSVQMEGELGVGATKHSDPGAACTDFEAKKVSFGGETVHAIPSIRLNMAGELAELVEETRSMNDSLEPEANQSLEPEENQSMDVCKEPETLIHVLAYIVCSGRHSVSWQA